MHFLIILAIISLFAAFSGSRPDETFYDEKGKRTGSVKYDPTIGEMFVMMFAVVPLCVAILVVTGVIGWLGMMVMDLFK